MIVCIIYGNAEALAMNLIFSAEITRANREIGVTLITIRIERPRPKKYFVQSNILQGELIKILIECCLKIFNNNHFIAFKFCSQIVV